LEEQIKKVLFLMAYPLDSGRGNNKQKFDGQMKSVKRLGYDVWFTACKDGVIFLCHNNEKIKIGKILISKRNFFKLIALCKSIFKIYKIQKFDLCYMRYSPCTFEIINALKVMKKHKTKIIVEIPTYPWRGEIKNNKHITYKFIILVLDFLYFKWMCKYIDLFTLIGENAREYGGIKAINIENGIDFDVNPLKENKNVTEEINILALAKMCYWHAYDRVIEGLKEYYLNNNIKREKILLHLVGSDGDGSLLKWTRMVKEYSLNKYVVIHGEKEGRELNEIFNFCDIGLGALGMYREDLDFTSSIKISVYCARGLPFIYSAKHNLLNERLKFCLKVANDNSPLNIEKVIGFVKFIRTQKNISKEMRRYAYRNMTWDIQFKKIFSNFNKKT
jgi:hypothetical protein